MNRYYITVGAKPPSAVLSSVAAAQFDELLQRSDRQLIEQAILDIAAGRGVR